MIYKDPTLLNFLLNSDFHEVPHTLGLSPLHLACLQNDWFGALILLESGVNSNIQDASGITPIYYAAQMGNIDILTLLINHGAQVNAYKIDINNSMSSIISGNTPLVCAIESGSTQAVLTLLNAGALINEPVNEYGWTALHAALAFPKDNVLEVVELLMAKGADPYIKIYNDENAFDVANRWGENVELQFLLHDTHFIADYDFSHYHHAIKFHDMDMLHGLIENGFNIDAQAPINGYDFMAGYTPLMYAIQYESFDSVAMLLNHGASVNELRDTHGNTALHIAVSGLRENTLEIVELLMEHGADPYLTDIHGENAFHMLNYWGTDTQVVRDILNHNTIGLDEVFIMDSSDSLDVLEYSNSYSLSLDLDEVLLFDNSTLEYSEGFSSDFPPAIESMDFLAHFELNISI